MRVLILAPYTIAQPLHGGQLRASAIVREFRANGHEVLFSGLYDPLKAKPAEIGKHDFPIVQAIHEYVADANSASELVFWHAFAEVPEAFAWFVDLVVRFKPDILEFEEPYLWPIVRELRRRGFLRGVKVIHSSYNFETQAKRDLKVSGLAITDRTLDDIAELEKEIALSVDAIVVVSESDAAAFRNIGAANVWIAHNGSVVPPYDAATADALDQYLLGEPFALFVSSAHPPNAFGLIETAEATDLCLKGGSLLVAGEVSNLLFETPAFWRNQHIFARTRFLGHVSQPMLGALYAAANVVILPKTRGGGSNLKTAEALLSGRPTVATPKAFQGFESFLALPGIFVEELPEVFWSRVDQMLRDAPQPCGHGRERAIEDLSWSACLRRLIRGAEALVRG